MKLKLLKKSSKYEKKHLPFPVYLSYCLIIALLLTSVTSARYLSSMSGSDNADVAKWIVDVESISEKVKFTMSRDSGDSIQTQNYGFNVNNYMDDTVSEVALQYDIVLILNKPLQDYVTMELVENDQTEYDYTLDDDNKTYIFKNINYFNANVKISHHYKIIFTGDFSQKLSSENYDITIQVNAQQID